jgi:L-fuculose-phosphate aldolase
LFLFRQHFLNNTHSFFRQLSFSVRFSDASDRHFSAVFRICKIFIHARFSGCLFKNGNLSFTGTPLIEFLANPSKIEDMSIYSIKKEYKEKVIAAGIAMADKNLTVETWGNISVRDPEQDLLYITPSGMPYNTLEADDIVICSLDGTVIEGKRTPSVETGLHALIYQKRKDVHAILHTHPADSMVFAILHQDIPVVTDEIAQAVGGPVRCADYALPGSKELAENCVRALGSSQACLLANHGAVCVGRDMKECFKVAAVLETGAAAYYKALAIGKPVEITEENTAWMRDFAVNRYGKDNQK